MKLRLLINVITLYFSPPLPSCNSFVVTGTDCLSIRAIFRNKKNITVLIGHVENIDKNKKEIFLKGSSQSFSYDYLIVAQSTTFLLWK